MFFVFHPRRPVGKQVTSPAKASSVPGITQTASPRSSAAEKPRVPVPKSRVTSLSLTFAGRERTLWRLKSHISRTPLLEAPSGVEGNPQPTRNCFVGGTICHRREHFKFAGRQLRIPVIACVELLTQKWVRIE